MFSSVMVESMLGDLSSGVVIKGQLRSGSILHDFLKTFCLYVGVNNVVYCEHEP